MKSSFIAAHIIIFALGIFPTFASAAPSCNAAGEADILTKQLLPIQTSPQNWFTEDVKAKLLTKYQAFLESKIVTFTQPPSWFPKQFDTATRLKEGSDGNFYFVKHGQIQEIILHFKWGHKNEYWRRTNRALVKDYAKIVEQLNAHGIPTLKIIEINQDAGTLRIEPVKGFTVFELIEGHEGGLSRKQREALGHQFEAFASIAKARAPKGWDTNINPSIFHTVFDIERGRFVIFDPHSTIDTLDPVKYGL